MSNNIRKFNKGLQVEPVVSTGIDAKGEMEVLSTGGKLNYHNGTTASPMVTESHSATLTNKTLTSPAITGPSITGNIAVPDLSPGFPAVINGGGILTNASDTTNVELGYVHGVTSAIQTQIDLKAPLANPALTGNPTAPTQSAGNNSTRIATTAYADALVSDIAYAGSWDGVTGIAPSKNAVYDQVELRAPKANPTFSGTITTPLTASRALATGASSELAVSATTSTELGYVNGVTSAIQTQLDTKISLTPNQYGVVASGASTTATVIAPDASLTKVLTSGGASANPVWTALPTSSVDIINLGLAYSVGASALTIALKQADGSTNPSTGAGTVSVAFRPNNNTGSSYTVRTLTAASSLVIPSGATLGFNSGSTCYAYVYAIDNAGTIELAVSSQLVDETQRITTIAITSAADINGFYSTSLVSQAPIRLIGYFLYNTAPNGTYSAVPDITSLQFTIPLSRIGDYTETKSATPTNYPTTNQYGDAGNLVLQPGTYDLTLTTLCNQNGGNLTFVRAGISTTSGNSSTGLVFGENVLTNNYASGAVDNNVSIPTYRVTPTSTTTYYAKVFAIYSATAPQYQFCFAARRIK